MPTKIEKATLSDAAAGEDKTTKTGIQSIVRAFTILEAIAERKDGIPLAELSKVVGLHKSTTFHLVKTMVQLGYVFQEKDTKDYCLGRPLYQLAAASRGDVQLAKLSRKFVEVLAQRTGETAHFAVPSQNNVVILSKVDGTSAFKLKEGLGSVRPGHCTAIGKVALAHKSAEQLDQFLSETELESVTPTTITDPERLRAELETVRSEGIAFDDAEYHSELRCVAVPVYDLNGGFAGAIGISGAVWRLSLSALQSKVPILREISAGFSAELGTRPDGGLVRTTSLDAGRADS